MTAILIALFSAGLYMTDLDYYDGLYHIIPWWHKSFGLLVLALLVLRLIWNLFNPKPVHLSTHKAWEKKAASIIHFLLYLLIFIICVSGYLISTSQGDGIEFFGWFDVPSALELNADNTDLAGEVHFYLAWTLIVLAAIHAVAALKHHFIDRDDTLNNMILRKK
jgi:cytochrome b561